MKRTVIVCLALLSACQSESELRFVSTLDAPTNGVRFSADGNESHVGMSGMTCTVSTEWGCPTDDADLPTEREVVLDHYEDRTLAASDGFVHEIDAGGWIRDADKAIPQVHEARYTAKGVLLLRGDDSACAVQLEGAETALPTELCAEGLEVTVDRSRATFYAATPDGVVAIDLGGVQKVSKTGDLVAWDAKLDQLYVATTGKSEVLALTAEGAEIWTTDVGLPIQDLEARGDTGQVLVMAKDEEGFGRLFRLDGKTGKIRGSSQLPDGEGDLVVSDNGQGVGIIRPDNVHFFELVVTSEGEEPVLEEDPKDCLDGQRYGSD